jgi:hypothetical protein
VQDASPLLQADEAAQQTAAAEIETTPDTETDEVAEESAQTVSLAKDAYSQVERAGIPTVNVSNARSNSVLVSLDRIVGTATDTSSTSLYLVA